MNSIFNKKDFDYKRDLTNHYFYTGIFTDEECELIKSLGSKSKVTEGLAGSSVRPGYRKSKIAWIPENKETKWLYDKLAILVKQANKICWNFDIIGFGEQLQYGEYNESNQGFYDWHLDMGKNSNWRKISISVQLDDENDYMGGDLQFYTKQTLTNAPRKKGTVIMFPSYLLHRVTPVIKGVRHSLVTWISGPPFR